MARYSNSVFLNDSGVVPGTYESANIVVNSKGLIISATDGTGSGGGSPTTLADLTDTIINTPLDDQFLRWNGTVWVNEFVGLDGLEDVALSTPNEGEVLAYIGGQWSNYDLSSAGVLTVPDIGVTVQAWDAGLDTLAAMDAVPGFVALTGSETFEKRLIEATVDGAISVINGDGVAGNVQIALDITNAITEPTIDTALDMIAFYDDSAGATRKTSINNFITSAGGVTDGINLGTGADVFVITNAGVMEYRGIDNANNGIVVSTNADTIFIGVHDNLNTISQLPTTVGNFIVANGTSWEAQNGITARTSLGLGTISTRDEDEFLELAGGTMAGEIDMGNIFKIVGLDDPTGPLDATNKQYVDAQVAAGVLAGDGLTKTGSTIDVINLDGTLTVATDEVRLNQASTDVLYIPRIKLESAVAAPGEGASNIGTPQKVVLGNAITVEEALLFINDNFTKQKFQMDLTSLWNLDVGAPNVNAARVRDVEVARFEPAEDTAVYVDFMLPPTYDGTKSFTFYTNWAKTTAAAGTFAVELAYQTQTAGDQFPARGTAPEWDWAVVAPTNIGDNLVTTNDNLVHTLEWIIPAGFLNALDTMSLRVSRMGASLDDDFALQADFFSGFIIEN